MGAPMGPPPGGMGGPPPGGDPNAQAAQAVMGRMTGGGAPGGPGEAGPASPEIVQQGRQMIQQLTMLVTSSPEVMAALKDDIIGFGMTRAPAIGFPSSSTTRPFTSPIVRVR